jgi:hypothetical protein
MSSMNGQIIPELMKAFGFFIEIQQNYHMQMQVVEELELLHQQLVIMVILQVHLKQLFTVILTHPQLLVKLLIRLE